MVEWMNQILGIIKSQKPNINKYKDTNGLDCSVPKRIWSSIHADTPLPSGSLYQIKWKPDIVLMWATKNLCTLQQSNILASGRTTMVSNNLDTEPTIKDQSYIMFIEQDNHCFIPAVYFQDNQFGFHTYNCNRLQTYHAPLQFTHSPSSSLPISSLAIQQPLAMMK